MRRSCKYEWVYQHAINGPGFWKVVKSITARRKFAEHPEVKKELWGGELCTDGHFVAIVGRHTNEEVIAKYVREQGKPDLED